MRSRSIVAVAALLAAACVTTYEDAPLAGGEELAISEFAVAQTIPIGDPAASPEERLLHRFYGGVLQRLQQAVDERDTASLFEVLGSYDRPGLPDWVAERLAGYRALGHGLAFLEHARARSGLRLVRASGEAPPTVGTVATPPIGAPTWFEFELPAMPTQPVRLGGADRTGFGLILTIEDDFVDGSSQRQVRPDLQWLEVPFELAGDAVLRLPLLLDYPAGRAVRRTIHVRVDLMPGYVTVGERRAPVKRRTLAAASWTQWPAGHEPIADRPLATLREALRLGDEQHFPHVYLGAMFTAGADREAAIGLLVDQVRLGNPAQAMVAMASLRAITDADIPVGDRQRWLAWFDLRR